MQQSSATNAERLWLSKIDTNGNTLWDFKYKEPDPDTTDLQVSVLTPTAFAIGNDGNYMVDANFRYTYGFPNGRSSALIKFSAVDGHVMWRYNLTLLDTTYTPPNGAATIIPIPNEGYVLVGSMPLKNGDWQGFLVKVNENGQELWRKTYGLPKEANGTTHTDYLNDGIRTLHGGFAAVGQTNCTGCGTDAWFVKTNCNGDTAAPVTAFSQSINTQNNTIVTIHNQGLRYDTCIFNFGDGSPLVYKSYLDTAAFTHTYPSYATNYNITMVAKACIQEWDSTQVPIFTGTSAPLSFGEGLGVRLIPNPNNVTFTITYNGNLTTPTYLVITDVYANEIDKIQITSPSTNYQNSNLANGLYFYSLQQNSVVVAKGKIIIVKVF